MAFIDVIKYEGPSSILVWKHPQEDFNTSAQLIVHESQEVIVYRDGQLMGPYTAGKHSIQTENIPGIRRLIGLATGGISPSHYVVYYINKVYSMDIHWATATDWKVQDPSLQVPLEMQARGQFAISVQDSKKLMQKLVGTMSSFSSLTLHNYFSDLMISRIKDHISNLIINEGISYRAINAHLVNMSEKIAPALADHFLKYGLKLEEFVVEGISVKNSDLLKELEKKLGERAMRVLDGTTKQEEMQYNVAMAQASNTGMGGQTSQMMTGMAAGVAMAPAVGRMVHNIMQPNGINGQMNEHRRDPFSMGVETKKPYSESVDKNICSSCGAVLPDNSRFCNQCGEPVVRQNVTACSCPVCGETLPNGSKFCNACGARI